MNSDTEFHIRHNYPWNKLPTNIKQSLGNNEKEYNKAVSSFSIRNQLRYKGNLVRHVCRDEKKYYESLLSYSRDHLMLYPYHLSDVIVKGLRTTPFLFYTNMMTDIMSSDRSYDSLPNFTAADCLRLLGIGRNQYIDLVNQNRSSKKFFRRKPVRELLPSKPVHTTVAPWWLVQAGFITEDDIKACSPNEKALIDTIIDRGPVSASQLDCTVIQNLYGRGLVYLEVPVTDFDCIIVPPLEGFVMNRVLGDYFETLLYKIFVSIDEHTTVAELSSVLQIDPNLVKNAVSMYCRLGFAVKKGSDLLEAENCHSSWQSQPKFDSNKGSYSQDMLIDWSAELDKPTPGLETTRNCSDTSLDKLESNSSISSLMNMNAGHSRRIGFLFDSTLTAFLMMGNLSPGLKSHAVTMFEVGKLSDESMDNFLGELEKVSNVAEGEAQRYFDHAITLKNSIKFLRYNKDLHTDEELTSAGCGIDLLRSESLLGLDPATCSRVLNKNYSLLVSMAPLSNEIRPITSCMPPHLGPVIPEVNSVWFKLFLYHVTQSGPPSLLLVKGTRVKLLPKMFKNYDKVYITTWGHDPVVVQTSNVLLVLNDALTHSAVFVQANGHRLEGETIHVPFPLESLEGQFSLTRKHCHSAIKRLQSELDLDHSCGYLTLLKSGSNNRKPAPSSEVSSSPNSGQPTNGITDSESARTLASELEKIGMPHAPSITDQLLINVETCDSEIESDWVLFDCSFGLPLFESTVNEIICERVLRKQLCNKDSLSKLMHSSRRLSLKLLDFIHDNQDLPVLMENTHSAGMLSTFNVPLPTHNLLFAAETGEVQHWNG